MMMKNFVKKHQGMSYALMVVCALVILVGMSFIHPNTPHRNVLIVGIAVVALVFLTLAFTLNLVLETIKAEREQQIFYTKTELEFYRTATGLKVGEEAEVSGGPIDQETFDRIATGMRKKFLGGDWSFAYSQNHDGAARILRCR